MSNGKNFHKRMTKLWLLNRVNEVQDEKHKLRLLLEQYEDAFRFLESRPWFKANRHELTYHIEVGLGLRK